MWHYITIFAMNRNRVDSIMAVFIPKQLEWEDSVSSIIVFFFFFPVA